MSSSSSLELPVLASLPAEARERVTEAPRAERLAQLAHALRLAPDQALAAVAEQSGLAIVTPEQFSLPLLQQMPVRLVHEYCCVPVATERPDQLCLATAWPPEGRMDDWVFAACEREPVWVLAAPEKIAKYLNDHLGVGSDSLDGDTTVAEVVAEEEEDEDAAVIRFVNKVVAQAVTDAATDIHFEPQEETLRIRYRVDGLLVPVPVPDNLRRFQDAITSRLKIMAKLNISERRLPQDGRIGYRVADTLLDIRLSTIPTMYGESVSLRLLNKKNNALTLDQLGMSAEDQGKIDAVLGLPHGIILVTGPTGSGKSTSLNAFIRRINSTDKRIITIEDPIEYEVPGANQMQVRPEIGLGFAEGLRHILRQDPNVIMVGEIRDRDTADIAIRASLTGHLVFSTIHTNDAPGALTRLTDMGIEPFLIASGVELVIAQRLVRRLCPQCSTPKPIQRHQLLDQLSVLGLAPELADGVYELPAAVGCEACRGLGYRGRVGVFEILRVDDRLHDLIVQRESARQMRKVAVDGGMASLEMAGWKQVRAGYTTLEEIVRVLSMAEGKGT
ncbi:MAG: Flp pilus assembly complex ATPase component TadA [Opitutaceae bacterium]|nr:Flp pilus assembly complex ATPase component TadA [Opitutaceae bacterium]